MLVFVILERQATLQHRRHRPALTPKVNEPLLREGRAVRRAEAGLGFAADQLAGPRVTVPRLTVERFDSGQQAGGQPQPGQHAEKLHRMAPPVTEQRRQRVAENLHVNRPLDNTTRSASRAATR